MCYLDDSSPKKNGTMNRLQFSRDCFQNKLNWELIIFSDGIHLFPDKQGKNYYWKYLRDVDFLPEYTHDTMLFFPFFEGLNSRPSKYTFPETILNCYNGLVKAMAWTRLKIFEDSLREGSIKKQSDFDERWLLERNIKNLISLLHKLYSLINNRMNEVIRVEGKG